MSALLYISVAALPTTALASLGPQAHEASAALDPRLLQEGETGPDQQGLVQAVWELSRLRRLLAYEVLQWATALHEGTPVARAAPPQAVMAAVAAAVTVGSSAATSLGRHSRHGSLPESLGRHSRHGSVDLEQAAATAAAASQQEQQQAASGREGLKAAAEEAPSEGVPALPAAGASLPPLPPETRLGGEASGTQPPELPGADALAVAAQQGLLHRRSSRMRHSSISLGAHIQSTMPQAGRVASSSGSQQSNYAPMLRQDGEGSAPSADSTASALGEQPSIPIGLVARYVSLFDDGTRPAGAAGLPVRRPPGLAQQRTLDWVQRASPPSAEGATAPIPAGGRTATAATSPFGSGSSSAAAAGTAHPAAARSAAQQGGGAGIGPDPSSHFVAVSDDEDDDATLSQQASANLSEASMSGQASNRRPSMLIDLANPDPELVSAFGSPGARFAHGACVHCVRRPGLGLKSWFGWVLHV